ncbi:unnamed protein product, partial [Rotaria magnacalcarata]
MYSILGWFNFGNKEIVSVMKFIGGFHVNHLMPSV